MHEAASRSRLIACCDDYVEEPLVIERGDDLDDVDDADTRNKHGKEALMRPDGPPEGLQYVGQTDFWVIDLFHPVRNRTPDAFCVFPYPVYRVTLLAVVLNRSVRRRPRFLTGSMAEAYRMP